VEDSGRQLHWVHVKGHSEDGGNDRADELVQWGKGKAPFCRLRDGGGEGETRYRGATAEENETRYRNDSEPEPEPVQSATCAIGRRGYSAADATIDFFNQLDRELLAEIEIEGGARKSVGSGDPLEGQ
jgi:hypothetical protein